MKKSYCYQLILVVILSLTINCIFYSKRPAPKLTEFSVNLLELPRGYFQEKFLSQAEKEALDKMGAPDYLRIYWDKVGSIMDETNALMMLRTKNSINEFKHSWVYINDGVEVLFPTNYKYEVKEIDDRIRLISQYGDPERVEKRTIENNVVQEVYTYYSYGKSFSFWNGKLMETNDFPATGKVIK